MGENFPLIWLIIIVCFAAFEAATVGLVAIWFGIGALVAMVFAAFGAQLWLQIVVFLVVSIIMLIFTKPAAQRFLKGKGESTNYDKIIGKTGYVLETIDNNLAVGQIKVLGQVWTARNVVEDISIPKDQKVKVVSISGVKAIVEVEDN